MGFDSKHNFASPSVLLGLSFVLGHGVSFFFFFFCEIQHSPVNGCSAVGWNFGVLAGEDEHMSFYSAILTSWQIDGETMETVTNFIFLGSKTTADGDCSLEIKRRLLLGRKAIRNLDSILKSRDITLLTKVHLVKAMVFPVVMYGCESWTIKRSWAPKNWCFWTVVLEKTLESPLDCKEIKPVHPKGDQSRIFTGRTDADAVAPGLWPPDVKSWLTGKDPEAGKDWRQEEKGATEDKTVGWHHRLNGYEFEQAPGVAAGQGSLVCCSPWGCEDSDITEQLNWTDWKTWM